MSRSKETISAEIKKKHALIKRTKTEIRTLEEELSQSSISGKEWLESIEGKPVSEWAPFPDEINYITYPHNRIVVCDGDRMWDFFRKGVNNESIKTR